MGGIVYLLNMTSWSIFPCRFCFVYAPSFAASRTRLSVSVIHARGHNSTSHFLFLFPLITPHSLSTYVGAWMSQAHVLLHPGLGASGLECAPLQSGPAASCVISEAVALQTPGSQRSPARLFQSQAWDFVGQAVPNASNGCLPDQLVGLSSLSQLHKTGRMLNKAYWPKLMPLSDALDYLLVAGSNSLGPSMSGQSVFDGMYPVPYLKNNTERVVWNVAPTTADPLAGTVCASSVMSAALASSLQDATYQELYSVQAAPALAQSNTQLTWTELAQCTLRMSCASPTALTLSQAQQTTILSAYVNTTAQLYLAGNSTYAKFGAGPLLGAIQVR